MVCFTCKYYKVVVLYKLLLINVCKEFSKKCKHYLQFINKLKSSLEVYTKSCYGHELGDSIANRLKQIAKLKKKLNININNKKITISKEEEQFDAIVVSF